MRAPHPGFRRLFTLGGTIARAAQRLGEPPAMLPRLARTQLDSALLGDDAVRALTSPPDLAALFAQVLPAGTAEPPARAAAQPGGAVPGAAAGSDALGLHDTLAGLRAGAPRTTRVSFPALPGEDDARRDRTPEMAEHTDAAAVSASVPSAQGEARGPSRSRGRRAGPAQVSPGQRAGSGQANRPEIADADAHRAVARTRRVLAGRAERLSAAGIRAVDSDASLLLDRSEATAQLRIRAARAGASSGADTRLVAHSSSEQVTALLSAAAVSPDRTAGAAGRPAHLPIQADAKQRIATTGALPALVRVLERIPSDATAGNRAARATSDAPRAPERDAGSAFSRIPTAEPTSGLRRLLSLHEASQPDAPRSNGPRELDRTPESGVVATRLRDSELAASLDRLLRREARRDGIDVEGLSG